MKLPRLAWLLLLCLALWGYLVDLECLTQLGHCNDALHSQSGGDCVNPVLGPAQTPLPDLPVTLPSNPLRVLVQLAPQPASPGPTLIGRAQPPPRRIEATHYPHRGPPLELS